MLNIPIDDEFRTSLRDIARDACRVVKIKDRKFGCVLAELKEASVTDMIREHVHDVVFMKAHATIDERVSDAQNKGYTIAPEDDTLLLSQLAMYAQLEKYIMQFRDMTDVIIVSFDTVTSSMKRELYHRQYRNRNMSR